MQAINGKSDSCLFISDSTVPVFTSNSRLERAQRVSIQTLQQVQKALEKRFSDLLRENTSLRQGMTSSTLQNRELILVQHQETGSLKEQLMATQAELAHVREEKESLHQQIQALREELRRKEEASLSKEQEVAHTIASLRQELKQARQDTLQRMEALQVEKESIVQEVRESVLQQVANGRVEERALANQDAERRICLLQTEHAQELDIAVKKAFEDGKFEFYKMFWRTNRSVCRFLRPYLAQGLVDPTLGQRIMEAHKTGQL